MNDLIKIIGASTITGLIVAGAVNQFHKEREETVKAKLGISIDDLMTVRSMSEFMILRELNKGKAE